MSASPLSETGSGAIRAAGLRLDYLDATRAFALVLGIVFHASLSFLPTFMGWAVQDISTSPLVGDFSLISHSFRMAAFFLLAGYFGCVTLQRKGAADFIRSRALRIVVPFVAGWFVLRPLLISGWIMGSASLRGDYDFGAGIRAGFKSLETLPAGMFTGTHLWFLYYLALITALALVVRALLKATRIWNFASMRAADRFTLWLAESRFALPVVIAPTAVALWFMQYWGMDTPDRSLWPHGPVTTIYGGFFAFGWMLARQPDAIGRLARLSGDRWVLAVAGGVGCLRLAGIQSDPGHPHYFAAHVGFVACYAATMWSLVVLTLGVFKKLCSRPRAWVRYVADSSYWMYLIHLPMVVWLQVAVAEFEVNWALKLAFVSAVTITVSLISYDALVRSTWVGWLLNGRRRERVLFGRGAGGFRRSMPASATLT
jgi:peptidoglycan/LPS O-acetylase OafA/YrhL